jgi:UDPglucose 6-dehydrogenase
LLNQERRPRIGVIGAGVVGGAVIDYFVANGYETTVYDPFKGLGSSEELDAAETIFICVPTPYRQDSGFDLSAVVESVALLGGSKTVVVKSTVIPGTTASLQERFPHHTLLFNPEFLRENSAALDFITPDRQIVGYCEGGRAAAEALLGLLPRAPYEAVMPASAAELTKYATNSFLAVKVIFGNQIYDLCSALGVDYEDVRDGLAADLRIGPSHLNVHGDGYRGYGGKCLPKDTLSLLDLAESLGVDLSVLSAASSANAALRHPACVQAPLLPAEAPVLRRTVGAEERRVA